MAAGNRAGPSRTVRGRLRQHERRFQSLPPLPETTSGVTVHESTSGSHRLKVTIRRQNCADTMSDETFLYSVEVEIDGARRRGCGTSLR